MKTKGSLIPITYLAMDTQFNNVNPGQARNVQVCLGSLTLRTVASLCSFIHSGNLVPPEVIIFPLNPNTKGSMTRLSSVVCSMTRNTWPNFLSSSAPIGNVHLGMNTTWIDSYRF